MNKIYKFFILIFTIHLFVFAQEEYYPPESYYGGGVGFSQMFLYQDFGKLNLTSKLPTGMFDTNDYDLPLVIYGGEGFSSLTQNITIGGFAGTGNTSIRHDQYMEQDIGNANPREGIIRNIARISLIMSGATLEYVFHPFSGLDISVGGLVGFGSFKFGLARTSDDVVWDLPDENQAQEDFISLFPQTTADRLPDSQYDLNGDGNINADDANFSIEDGRDNPNYYELTITNRFVNFQPYIAVKLRLLSRMGLRLTVGYNFADLDKNRWEISNGQRIYDVPETQLGATTIRAMLYFGL